MGIIVPSASAIIMQVCQKKLATFFLACSGAVSSHNSTINVDGDTILTDNASGLNGGEKEH